jgi:dihydrofolate reductase
MITLIAALATNHVIGNKGVMPWRLRTDLAHLKRETMGKPIIMGRKTYQSLGKPLPGRQNIVLTSHDFPEVTCVKTIEEALKVAQSDDIMIIGGEEIYKAFLPLADRLILTHVQASPEGDAFFPSFTGFTPISETTHKADENNDYDMRFVTYQRH